MSLQIEIEKDVDLQAVASKLLGGSSGELSDFIDPTKFPKSTILTNTSLMIAYSLNGIPYRVLFEADTDNSAGIVSSADLMQKILPGQLTTSFPGILVQGVSP